MTMDSMELPSISSTTSISDNPALRNYYEKLLFKNSSNKSLTDFQDKFNSNSNNDLFDENEVTNRVDFIKGFSNSNNKTNSTSTSTSSTTNHSPMVANEQYSPLSKLDSQQQFENVDPKKRVNKVIFPSLQIIPNELNNDSTEQSDEYDVSMFKPVDFKYENVNVTKKSNAQVNGRRQSIFNFANTNKDSNNNIGIQMSSSQSNTTSISNDKTFPIFSNFNFGGTNNHQIINNNNMNLNITGAGNLCLPNRQALFASERRSSYISDSLIHHNNYQNIDPYITNNNNTLLNNYQFNGQNGYIPMTQNMGENFNIIQNNPDMDYYKQIGNNGTETTKRSNDNGLFPQRIASQSPATLLNQMFNNTNNISPSNIKPSNNGYPYNKLSNIPSQNERYSTSTIVKHNYNDNNFIDPFVNNQRRNTQPALFPMNSSSSSSSNNNMNFNGNSNKNNQYGYLKNLNNPRYTTTTSPSSSSSNGNNNMTAKIDNNTKNSDSLLSGLILLGTGQLTSSLDLQKIYEECGKNYFSSERTFQFSDYIKDLLKVESNDDDDGSKDAGFLNIKKSVLKFLSFLKSCNLNYNPQSDAFVSKENSNNSNSNIVSANDTLSQNSLNNGTNSTSSYLHYKPLVLVSLKNGKLELLSVPSNSNLVMKRGDLIIIDGDRGKDLALVVEPKINLDMALMINFLKKKIHFDSLITNRDQHYPNEKFIDALVNVTQGLTDELDPKLYDVIELIQLVVPSKQIVRFATPWEVSTNLHNKFQDELKALHIAQLKLKSLNNHDANCSYGNGPVNNARLNIKILNAEFQFDRKKLTFYYICEERNDFRELIKELFKFYKTRIWLCAIPNNLNIDQKYYDNQQYELKMYKDMMSHYVNDDLTDKNFQKNGTGGFVVAPPLDQLKLDDFQIGVYQELVKELFSSSQS